METDKLIIKALLKGFTEHFTVTSLAAQLMMSRVGTYKALKKLEEENQIILSKVGKGKTSTYSISLNWDNPLTEKTLSLVLTEESMQYQRWISNFKNLEGKMDFLILFGSILHSSKQANDIDIAGTAMNGKSGEIESEISRIQKTQLQRIHAEIFSAAEFQKELKNQIFKDAIRKGIVLFGQERFIRLIREAS